MTKTMKKANVAGFSLVELMVVVAIIGILSAVAIPNFQRFQRKARASEGQALISSVRASMEAFHAEWDTYSSDLNAAGMRVAGQTQTHFILNGAYDPTGTFYPVAGQAPLLDSTLLGSAALAGMATPTFTVGTRACAPTAVAPATARHLYSVATCSDIGNGAGDPHRLSATNNGTILIDNDGIE